MTDDELMILIQSGDGPAFRELVDRYQGMLIGFFVRNTRDLQFSEDLTQETLLKVYSQAWDYLPLGRFRGWMFRIARNLLIDNERKRAHDALIRAVRRQSADEDAALERIAGEFLSPEAHVQAQEFSALLDDILSELPEEQRQTLLLHYYSGIALPEVAEILEIPDATCKSRLRLARQKMAEKLRVRGFGPQLVRNLQSSTIPSHEVSGLGEPESES